MGIWIELRCERRGGHGERPTEMVCWSDGNTDPGTMADDSANGLREAYQVVKQAALNADWKLVRGEGWVCPCCLAYQVKQEAAGLSWQDGV